jgi:phage terminase large subunit GpA-like protein
MAPANTLEGMALQAAEGVRPPERLTVSQAAEKYRYINNKGSYVGQWKNSTTPYLIEPQNILQDLRYSGMIFVGPAQCGKTEIYLNWHTFTVRVDPADLTLVQTSQSTAADFSKRRVDRLHRDSPEVGSRLIHGRNYDNTFDKRYRSGSMVTLSWPSINELSGRPIPRMFLTDYDRMDQDVDKNGSPYDLAAARTTTFGRHGMTAAESSPSFPVSDPRWTPSSRHEAPPTEGILALYNRGDRRRWYWPCASCGHWFEPDFKLMKWPESKDLLECAEAAWLECPHCQAHYVHGGNELPGKHDMNRRGAWVRDGETITPDGEITGVPMRSQIGSFWLKGPAATFKNWTTLVLKYLQAEQEFRQTGSEDALKATVNVDQGSPYLPKSAESDRLPEVLKNRARDFGHKTVPPGVRFLIAAVDVQKNRFEVQVHGIGQGGDVWVIDRFALRYSRRPDEDREGQVHFVRPFTYKEDWRILLDEVIAKTYPLGDGSGRHMAVKATISDSGGQDEGTANAYEFYRWLKNGPNEEDLDKEDWPAWAPGLHGRFQLYKGRKIGPRVQISYPDSQRKDRHAGARGEIPILLVNANSVKNQIDSMLEREGEFTGRVNFASWLEINFYKELCVEVKNHKGEWENPKKFRNESWDLLVMTQAMLIETKHVGIERIDWSDPPGYAQEWDDNDLVFTPDGGETPIASVKKKDYDLSKIAQSLG